MASCFLNKKGQISIEFVLILLIGLIYLNTISSAVIYPAIDSAKDVSNIGEARLAVEKIVNSVNELAASPGEGKKTINVFVPEKTTITCTGSAVKFSVQVAGNNIGSCKAANDGDDDHICSKSIAISAVDCTGFPILNRKSLVALKIAKVSGGTVSIS